MNKEILRECLKGISAVSLREAKEVVGFFDDVIEKEKDGPALSEGAKGAFIAAMLIEYGKQKAKQEEKGGCYGK